MTSGRTQDGSGIEAAGSSERAVEANLSSFLADAGVTLAATLDSSVVLERVVALAVPALAEWCAVHVSDGDGVIRTVALAHARENQITRAWRLLRGRGLPGPLMVGAYRVLRGEGPLVLDNAANDPLRTDDGGSDLDDLRAVGCRTALVVPVTGRDRVHAAITLVAGEDRRRYTHADLPAAEGLAQRAAVALENARAFEAERRARELAERTASRVSRLQRLTDALSYAVTPEDAIRIMLPQIRSAAAAELARLFLLDGRGRELQLVATDGVDPGSIASPLPMTRPSLVGESIKRAEVVSLARADLINRRFPDLQEPHNGWIAVPLRLGGRALGAMLLAFAQPTAPSVEERQLLAAAAGQCAQALDRTRLFQAEETARAAAESNEQKYRFLTEVMPQMVWTAPPDGSIDYCNQNWIAYTGTDLAGTEGTSWTDVVHPEDRDKVRLAWHRAFEKGGQFESLCRLRDGHGGHRWFLARAQPLRDPDGRVTKWMGTCTDVHDQTVAYEMVKLADRRKDEFLALLGHELRNPLAPIAAAVQLMKLRGDRRTERERDVIERQVKHLTRLVDDLLQVSRITRGKIELKRERLELASVLEKALEMARPQIEARQHHLDLQVPRRGLMVDGDPVRLAQVFQNLLTNAAKYTDEGGEIRVEARRDDGEVVVSVIDDGTGIPPELLDSVFEPFVQGERSLDRADGGLGIGLTVVQRLVQLHGGQVSVHSDGLGKGSTFTVRLALLKQRRVPETRPPKKKKKVSKPAAKRGAVSPKAQPTGRRILVVDDNVDLADTLARLLEQGGHDVRVAVDGRRALSAVETFLPELALLDIGLPRMDGYELAQRLRRSLGPGVKLVAVTGYGQDGDKRRSQAAGFDDHLVKPVDMADIDSLIARLGTRAPARRSQATASRARRRVG